MTAYQVMPPLAEDERAALVADIAANGIRVPIDVDEWGQILDGHHRAEIADELGIDCPIREMPGLTDAEKVAHAYAVNLHRRSLSREQRRALVAASLARDPGLSDREHGKRTGVDGKTVASVREDMESTAELPQLDSRTGADGKVRPAVQPTRPASWSCDCGAAFKSPHTHCPECGDHYPAPQSCPTHTVTVDTTTGEVLDGPTGADRERLPEVPTQIILDCTTAFGQMARTAVLIEREADRLADGYQRGDEFHRRQWDRAITGLINQATALADAIAATPKLRRVK